MSTTLSISPEGALDFVSLGALVHRLDPGIIPFRKATQCSIHVSGGEFNVAANLADCFGLRTAVATAMVRYPIGDLVAERVRAMAGTDWPDDLARIVYIDHYGNAVTGLRAAQLAPEAVLWAAGHELRRAARFSDRRPLAIS